MCDTYSLCFILPSLSWFLSFFSMTWLCVCMTFVVVFTVVAVVETGSHLADWPENHYVEIFLSCPEH